VSPHTPYELTPRARRRPAQEWLDTPSEWGWPGVDPDLDPEPAGEAERAGPAVLELLPPEWVPVRPGPPPPPRYPIPARPPRRRPPPRWAGALALVGCVSVIVLAVLAVIGLVSEARRHHAHGAPRLTPVLAVSDLPPLHQVSVDQSGSAVDSATYASRALGATGSFLVVLPPGFPAQGVRYPVLYVLPDANMPANALLSGIGLQSTLDRLELAHSVGSFLTVIVGMPAGTSDPARTSAYVLEIQRLVDRMLATRSTRSARALAGAGAGGDAALLLALSQLARFSAVESWSASLRGIGAAIDGVRVGLGRQPLSAYLYGATGDTAVDPTQNAIIAASLTDSGATATAALYNGTSSPSFWQAHLPHMLLWAGRALGV
jgi:enterochelin esterase-like enzyme